MAKPILYSYYRSSCSYRVRIALYVKETDFEYRAIHLVKDGGEQHTAEYERLNPKREVPYFIDGDYGLSQSMAIIHYIDSKWPSPRLFPEDPYLKAKCIEICEVINAGIQPLQNTSVGKELKKRYQIDDHKKNDWIKTWIERGFQALEAMVKPLARTYALGEEITAADLFIVPQVYNAHRYELNMSNYPTIAQINDNCLKLEPFQKAAPDQQPDTPA